MSQKPQADDPKRRAFMLIEHGAKGLGLSKIAVYPNPRENPDATCRALLIARDGDALREAVLDLIERSETADGLCELAAGLISRANELRRGGQKKGSSQTRPAFRLVSDRTDAN